MYINDVMTVPASLAGLPALSLPIQSTETNLPFGLQLIGCYEKDFDLLYSAQLFEKIVNRTDV